MEEKSASNRVIGSIVLLAHLGKKRQEAWCRTWLAKYPKLQPPNPLEVCVSRPKAGSRNSRIASSRRCSHNRKIRNDFIVLMRSYTMILHALVIHWKGSKCLTGMMTFWSLLPMTGLCWALSISTCWISISGKSEWERTSEVEILG